jgi:hypothetical protein
VARRNDNPPHIRPQPLTAERLRAVLHYDPATGVFVCRVARGSRRIGEPVGTFTPDGPVIALDKRQYRAARLAYLYMTGDWPRDRIDIANRNNRDLRWENLRPATSRQDHANRLRRAIVEPASRACGATRERDVSPRKSLPKGASTNATSPRSRMLRGMCAQCASACTERLSVMGEAQSPI